MKYLLFVYPSEDTWDENVSNSKMVSELATVTQSDEIKYVYGESHTLFHFDSPLSPCELADFVTLLKEDVGDFMFVLVESFKSIESNIPEDNLSNLLKINKRGRKPKKSNRIKNIFSKSDDGFDIKKFMEEHNARVLDFLKNNTCDLTIDEILDKIIDQGIDSLTKEERDTLDKHSREI
jgi:hypothetical protein